MAKKGKETEVGTKRAKRSKANNFSTFRGILALSFSKS
jgi:hypothetical protein